MGAVRAVRAVEAGSGGRLVVTVGRLAVYGSLAPGAVNHGVVADLPGVWTRGAVRGVLREQGWGAPHGFPGLEWHPDAAPVPVHVFTSDALAVHWARLDAFEGAGYRRTLVPVERPGGPPVPAFIYLIRWADPDLRPALDWITRALAAADAPFAVTGGLAARIHGAVRPVVDVDVWVTAEGLARVLPALEAHLVRPPGPHRDAHWDLTVARLEIGGVPVELGVLEDARYREASSGRWVAVTGGALDRTVSGQFQGVRLPVAPAAVLLAYKRALARPVDLVDVWQLSDASHRGEIG